MSSLLLLFRGAAAAPQNIQAGQAAEADVAQAVTRRKIRTLGKATEADVAQALSKRKLRALGVAGVYTPANFNADVNNTQFISGSASGTKGLSQAFVASVSGPLSKVVYDFFRFAANPNGNLVAKLYSVTGTVGVNALPNAVLATSAAVPANSYPLFFPGRGSFDFDGSVSLVQGNAYALSLEYTGTTTGSIVGVSIAEPGVAQGNGGFFANGIWGVNTDPLVFETYLQNPAGTAQPISRLKVKSLGLAAEANSAQALTKAGQTKPLGRVVEDSTAQTLLSSKSKTFARASESDSAQALARTKAKVVGQALQTDAALVLSRQKIHAISEAVETNLAQPAGRAKLRALGQAVETSTAQSLRRVGPISVALDQVVENDSARAFASAKSASMAQASESNAAATLAPRKVVALGTAVETSSARSLTVLGSEQSAVPEEPVISGLRGQRAFVFGPPIVVKTAKVVPIGRAAERDFARGLAPVTRRRPVKKVALGAAIGEAYDTELEHVALALALAA